MKRRGLKAARQSAKLTQEQLARASGIRQATISRIERGKILNPTFDTVAALAQVLRVDPRTLVFGQPESIAS